MRLLEREGKELGGLKNGMGGGSQAPTLPTGLVMGLRREVCDGSYGPLGLAPVFPFLWAPKETPGR